MKVGGLGGLPPSRMEETSIQENHPWNKNILKLEVTISKEQLKNLSRRTGFRPQLSELRLWILPQQKSKLLEGLLVQQELDSCLSLQEKWIYSQENIRYQNKIDSKMKMLSNRNILQNKNHLVSENVAEKVEITQIYDSRI